MQVSYLGTAQNGELSLWVLESEHAAHFLLRRIRRSSQTISFWALVPHTVGAQIGELLQLGFRTEATALLKVAATDCGRILRMSDDTPVLTRTGQ